MPTKERPGTTGIPDLFILIVFHLLFLNQAQCVPDFIIEKKRSYDLSIFIWWSADHLQYLGQNSPKSCKKYVHSFYVTDYLIIQSIVMRLIVLINMFLNINSLYRIVKSAFIRINWQTVLINPCLLAKIICKSAAVLV